MIHERRRDGRPGTHDRVDYPDGSTAVVVIEDRERVVVAPNAQIAMADVRPGEEVEARYVQYSSGDKSMLSIVPVVREIQAP